mmetsp:Transcript_1422/g.3115  ORF Transcript_1422/g.3115 Transcript_1422/m.3115 type:complete len:498 (-) Transcript_1422:217-1710(-)
MRRRVNRPLFACLLALLCLAVDVFRSESRRCFAGCRAPHRNTKVRARASGGSSSSLDGLKVAIAGAGPSGLLLAHKLLEEGATVEIIESRSDPRAPEAGMEGRAYALGLGIRGRTAIRTVSDLWDAVKPAGFGSEKFKLHTPLGIVDLRKPGDSNGLEPSLLIYQTDLCGAILNELDARHGKSGRLTTKFMHAVESVNTVKGEVKVKPRDGDAKTLADFDLIAGCDGVNSRVRAGIAEACQSFTVERNELPGLLKVLRLESMPAELEDDAVHAIPGKGGSTAFVEPTAKGVCVLVNWRDVAPKEGEESERTFSDISDSIEVRDVLCERFPLLKDRVMVEPKACEEFVAQQPSRAATVRCNTYHHGKAALLGDAAHSTGGASGQGCNSALQDSVELVEKLKEAGGDVPQALAAYSLARVPEGHALLDLSVGPSSGFGRALLGLKNFLDGTGLTGGKQLQTELTQTLRPFSEIRRDLDLFFGSFPSDSDYKASTRLSEK